MKELIENWLKGSRNYIVGKVLYNRFGSDEDLKVVLATRTQYTEERLLDELTKLARGTAQPKVEKQSIVAVATFPDSADDVLKQMKDEWMPLYTEMNYKRHELDRYAGNHSKSAVKKRGELARDILNLEQQCMKVWRKRDHYIEFGKLPEPEIKEPIVDAGKLAERYVNVQGYIRRYKMYLRKDPQNRKYNELLKSYEKELEELRKKRGN